MALGTEIGDCPPIAKTPLLFLFPSGCHHYRLHEAQVRLGKAVVVWQCREWSCPMQSDERCWRLDRAMGAVGCLNVTGSQMTISDGTVYCLISLARRTPGYSCRECERNVSTSDIWLVSTLSRDEGQESDNQPRVRVSTATLKSSSQPISPTEGVGF